MIFRVIKRKILRPKSIKDLLLKNVFTAILSSYSTLEKENGHISNRPRMLKEQAVATRNRYKAY
ncbi:hypothetical protein [Propionispora hippei]|uniref:Uncharacterized protein n=1 Tax=Propionispora hippei DSM 15287 TaxID=1123003 RepID=A0A1M6H056_9FIRM|nr:hypothetical protein [Propionispora hippei]SHJ15535.1 hypothetical protein SAMN02745170_01840 [Propionispora hippei DSM 15287]